MYTIVYDLLVVISIPITLIYIVIPILFVVAPKLMQRIFFLNFVTNPFANYENLRGNGILSLGRNFFLQDGKRADDIVRTDSNSPLIGAWHILPVSLSQTLADNNPTDDDIENTLRTGKEPVFIYLHGNSFDRATKHRCELYNTLSAMNFHIIVIDYRGFGDSKGYPTEDGLAADGHSVFQYVRSLTPDSKSIYVWGHSMGTGVATRLVSELCHREHAESGRCGRLCPAGLVLESSFNNLRDVVRNHPFSAPLRFLPFFDDVFVTPLIRCGLVMNSDVRIGLVRCPILILHAADDHIIPVKLARNLFRAAQMFDCRVTYVEFAESSEFKHRYICRAKELFDLMQNFLHECVQMKQTS